MLLVKICMKVEIRALRALAGECWSHQARAQKENITYVFVILLFSSYCPCFRLFAAFEPPRPEFPFLFSVYGNSAFAEVRENLRLA